MLPVCRVVHGSRVDSTKVCILIPESKIEGERRGCGRERRGSVGSRWRFSTKSLGAVKARGVTIALGPHIMIPGMVMMHETSYDVFGENKISVGRWMAREPYAGSDDWIESSLLRCGQGWTGRQRLSPRGPVKAPRQGGKEERINPGGLCAVSACVGDAPDN